MDKMTAIARSRLGVNLKEFFSMTPREFIFALRDLQELKISENQTWIRTTFESMRLQTMILLNANPYVKKRHKDVRKFLPFTWDESPIQSQEEIKAKLLSIANTINNRVRKRK